jgi:hypothetical protein
MKKVQPYRPHTVLAGGIARLGDALAKPIKPVCNPTQPKKTMPNPPKPGRPAKPAQAKKLPASEDYSSPYKPPVPVPAPAPLASAPVDLLADIQIDDDVPEPPKRGNNGKIKLMGVLLLRLKVGQSARLKLDFKSSLQKATQIVHRSQMGRFRIVMKHDDDMTLRVWRVS